MKLYMVISGVLVMVNLMFTTQHFYLFHVIFPAVSKIICGCVRLLHPSNQQSFVFFTFKSCTKMPYLGNSLQNIQLRNLIFPFAVRGNIPYTLVV